MRDPQTLVHWRVLPSPTRPNAGSSLPRDEQVLNENIACVNVTLATVSKIRWLLAKQPSALFGVVCLSGSVARSGSISRSDRHAWSATRASRSPRTARAASSPTATGSRASSTNRSCSSPPSILISGESGLKQLCWTVKINRYVLQWSTRQQTW